jgi:THAP4-like, heme-binding beta-barrel domain
LCEVWDWRVSLVRVTHASLAPDVPELVQPFAFLLGSWRGDGVGGYPTIDGGDFRYGQEVRFSCPGKPLIAYTSRSWSLDDDRTLSLESGFWRPTGNGEIEVVLNIAAGLVEVLYGRLVSGSAGEHLEMESDLIGHTATAKQVDKDKRMYAVRGGKLMYAMEMAALGQPLQPHLSAALDPVPA